MPEKNNEFTFGVITYNSSRTIIETLESIRYQVEAYGMKYRIYLIVSDDCSTDDTVSLVEIWINKYSYLFYKTILLTTETNSGLCRNFCLLMRNIKTEYYKLSAGDDLLCSQNVIDSIMSIDDNEVRVYLPIIIRNGRIQIERMQVREHIYYMGSQHDNKRDLRNMVTISPYTTVQICMKRSHYSEDCLNYLENFRNFEDNTALCYMFRENNSLTLHYVFERMLLYRRSNTSLSAGMPSMHQIMFLDDLHRFNKENFYNEKNFVIKAYLGLVVWDSFLMKHRFAADKTLRRRIYYSIRKSRAKKARMSSQYKKRTECLKKYVQEEQHYYEEIKKEAHQFCEYIASRNI